jgi:hypothetical protein
MSDDMQGFNVRLDDLEGFKNGVVDFAANYEQIVDELTKADLRESKDKWQAVRGHPVYTGKAGEFSDSCEAFVNNYADLMQLLLRVNTAIRNELKKNANGLTATHDSYAELDSQNAGAFQDVLNAMTPQGTQADGSA